MHEHTSQAIHKKIESNLYWFITLNTPESEKGGDVVDFFLIMITSLFSGPLLYK